MILIWLDTLHKCFNPILVLLNLHYERTTNTILTKCYFFHSKEIWLFLSLETFMYLWLFVRYYPIKRLSLLLLLRFLFISMLLFTILFVIIVLMNVTNVHNEPIHTLIKCILFQSIVILLLFKNDTTYPYTA